MRIGDIIVVSGESFISRLIQRVVGSKWTHVALYVGGGYVLQIDWNSKASIVLNPYANHDYDFALVRTRVPITEKQQKQIVHSATSYDKTGNKYDFLLLIGLFLKAKFPKWKALHFNGKNTFICTELVYEVLKEAGIDLFPKSNGVIYPHDFMKNDLLQVLYTCHQHKDVA